MNEAIGAVLPLGVAVTISPVPIIAVVLMLATGRGRVNGSLFVLGWIIGLAVVGAVVLAASGGAAEDDGEPATWVGWLQLGLGVLLLAVAVRGWRGRNAEKETPKWMAAVDAVTPVKAFRTAVLLAGLNPKNLLLTVAAAAAIAETGIDDGDEAIALAVYIVIGTLGPLAPVAVSFLAGRRATVILDHVRSWMAANNAAIMAVLMLIIGVKLFGDGLAAL
jgi:threonine/homoserine/homoserine lactone efflux protein